MATSTTRSAAEASSPVPVLSAAVSSVVVSTPLVPTSSVLSSVPSSAAAVFPLPYVPHLPWPSASFQLPPVSAQQQSFSTLPSFVSQSSLFTSPPSCLSGPVPGSLTQTVNQLNPIHQPVLPNPIAQQVPPIPISQQALLHPVPHQVPPNPIPQQAPPAALHQQALLPQTTQHQLGSPMLQQLPTLEAATYQPIVQHAGLGQLSGMSGHVPRLAEAFVVGPGFLPIPYKTVVAITSGQFVDLSSLLVKPSEPTPSGPIISIDGLIVMSQTPKPPRRLQDITQWAQAFSLFITIFTLVMVSYCPWRAIDLLKYQLLILRTQAQFGGLAWLNYDEAFRRDAAARHVTDWSNMHVELYNFHTASARIQSPFTPRSSPESSGARFSTTICRSWNAGRCISPRAVCRYLHMCDSPRCRGPHRRIHCPNHPSSQPPPQFTSLPSAVALSNPVNPPR